MRAPNPFQSLAFSEEYFIHVQGEQKGPYTFPQLKRLYEKNLIPEETLYWRDGMEQLEPVSDLCGKLRRVRLRRFKQLRVLGMVLVAAVALLTAWCTPVLQDVWREANDRDPTQEGAYWKARGFVREAVKKQQGADVAFQPYSTTGVTLTGTEATVILPGTLFAKNGTAQKLSWKVTIRYDALRKEWRLPAQ
jgi:hypothetical protein